MLEARPGLICSASAVACASHCRTDWASPPSAVAVSIVVQGHVKSVGQQAVEHFVAPVLCR
jgi:hypothetical protein